MRWDAMDACLPLATAIGESGGQVVLSEIPWLAHGMGMTALANLGALSPCQSAITATWNRTVRCAARCARSTRTRTVDAHTHNTTHAHAPAPADAHAPHTAWMARINGYGW